MIECASQYKIRIEFKAECYSVDDVITVSKYEINDSGWVTALSIDGKTRYCYPIDTVLKLIITS